MNNLLELKCNLEDLKNFSIKLANNTNFGDIYLLEGDLGAGKTTFARFFINSLSDKYKVKRPDKIKSPTFPIMINYPLKDNEIYHYDLYRIKNKNELIEIDLFENLKKNIFLVEWPKIVIDNFLLNNYYLITFKFVGLNKRLINIFHSKKKVI